MRAWNERSVGRLAAATLGAAALLVSGGLARAQAVTLKVATLAPEGSSWMNRFHEWSKAIEDRTGGDVRIKFYAGGVSGDERDFVRKMRLGQLGAAAVTSIGLGLIQPEVRVLEVPMLTRSYDELSYVRTQLDGELRRKIEDKGYVLLSWGDVGPVHVFSNLPIRSRADLVKTRLWEWVDDPISKALLPLLGVRGVPLGVPDVLPSLQTGIVDAVCGSPLATLALQWGSKVRYMSAAPLAQAIGATVIAKRELERMTPAQRQVLLEESRKLEERLLKEIRADNDRALAALQRSGLQVVDMPPALTADLETASLTLRSQLEPALYSHDLRVRVEKLVAQYRSTQARR